MQVSDVSGQDFQRSVSWTAPSSLLPISTFVVSCTSQESILQDLRQKEVVGSATQATIGDGSGENAALAQGKTYSCKVAAVNAAGNATSTVSNTFNTYVR